MYDVNFRELMQALDYGAAPESATPINQWLEHHHQNFGHYINGQFLNADNGDRLEVINPANEQHLAEVSQGDSSTIDRAVQAACEAFPSWSKTDGHERARHLYAIARHIQKHARFLAVLESTDNGKPIRESRDGDVPLVARHFYHHAGWAELVGNRFPNHHPVGVCGQIIPWNFPLLMLAWKIAPALAAGNTVVLKPAESTSLTALAFAEICNEVGLPSGIVNIITGDGSTGEALVRHPDIAKIAFTGSTGVGRRIRESTAGTGKKLSLELGGKSPFIVFEDADLDAAVEGVINSTLFNQGEVCCAGSRILVQESVEDLFHKKLTRRLDTLRVGDPLDKSTDVGAIVSRTQLERITGLVGQGCAEGAQCYQPTMDVPATGFYYPPTLLTEVDTASELSREEIFGPVVTSSSFRTPDEAILLANNTRYGLAASVYSESITRALETAAGIKAGVIWVNTANQFDAAAGFGGYRESGYGREGGLEGIYEYLTLDVNSAKSINVPAAPVAAPAESETDDGQIDRTAKLYIGGKQNRPDAGYSYAVRNAAGSRTLGLAPYGNRKDIRNAVAAACSANSWTQKTGHARAQILYYLAENFSARENDLIELVAKHTGANTKLAQEEVQFCIRWLFYYAALADKVDGRVHSTIGQHVTLAMKEPWGVMGILCPDASPLRGLIGLAAPALAFGNRVIAITSQSYALAALEVYHLLESSDLPAGVLNLISGDRTSLAKVLAGHDEVNAMWVVTDTDGLTDIEALSSGNLKPIWSLNHDAWKTFGKRVMDDEFVRQAQQVKNIWIPYGKGII